MVGRFSGSTTLGTATFTSSGTEDYYLVKYSGTGNLLWARQILSPSSEAVRDIAVDGSGNVFLVGKFYQSIIFTSTTGSSNLSGARTDYFIAKYNRDGVLQWARQSSNNAGEGHGISADAAGNTYIVGNFTSSGIVIGSTSLTTGSGTEAMFLAKYDPAGNVLWAKRGGGGEAPHSNWLVPKGLSKDVSKGIYVTGLYMNYVYFGSTTLIGTTSTSNTNIFVAKFTGDGNLEWAQQVGGSDSDTGNAIANDTNGNAYVTGTFQTGAVFGGTITLNSQGGSDVFVAKYAANGTIQWVGQGKGYDYESVNDIGIDANKDVYIVGTYGMHSVSFGTVTLPALPGSGNVNRGAFITKYASSGTVQWAKSITGDKYASGQAVSAISPDNFYLLGSFSGNIIVANTLNGGTDPTRPDILLAKFNSLAPTITALLGSTATAISRVNLGETITINGTNFTAPVTVKFNTATATEVTLTSATQLTAKIPLDATKGRVSVTNAHGTGYSSSDFIICPPAPVAEAAIEACAGETATISVSSPVAGVTYKWYKEFLYGGPYHLVGTGTSYTIPARSGSDLTYYVTASLDGCESTWSTRRAIFRTPSITVNDKTVCIGNSVRLDATAGSTGYTFKWFDAATGGTELSDQAFLNTPVFTTAGDYIYYVQGTSPQGCVTDRKPVKVTVWPALANNTISTDQTICSGRTPDKLIGTIPTGGSGTYSYIWYKSTTSATDDFTSVSSSQEYTPPALYADTWYKRKVATGSCTSESNVVKITVNPAISNNILSGEQTICRSATVEKLTGSTPAGGTGTYTYRWEKSFEQYGTYYTVDGATEKDYTPYQGELATGDTWFRRVVTSGDCSQSMSTPVRIRVRELPTAAFTVNGALLSATANSSYTYQWLLNGNPIANATSQTYTATVNGSYSVKVTHSTTNCEATSAEQQVTITGVADELEGSFKVYPNPAKKEVHVELAEAAQLEIISLTGQVLHAQQTREAKAKLDVSKLGKGVYFLKVTTKKGTAIKRFIKE